MYEMRRRTLGPYCKKPTTTHPKCANCEGKHLSTYMKCPKNTKYEKFGEAPIPKENPWQKKKEENFTKYAETAEVIRTEPKSIPTSSNDELAQILGRMVIALRRHTSTQTQAPLIYLPLKC